MKKNESVKTIMTHELVTVQLGEKPSKVRAILKSNAFHHLPVLDGERLVGIISSLDFMNASFAVWGADQREIDAVLDAQLKLAQLMRANPRTISDSAMIREAAQALSSGDIHSLPVVDAKGKLVGIVTSTDLIRYLLEQY